MNQDEIKQLVITAIQEVAPEMEEADIDPDEDLREECDLDSMDFLRVLEAIKKTSGITVPELDYFKVNTLHKMTQYLSGQVT